MFSDLIGVSSFSPNKLTIISVGLNCSIRLDRIYSLSIYLDDNMKKQHLADLCRIYTCTDKHSTCLLNVIQL